MGESRQELLQWMNSLLQLNITKIEQCGTGAAYCQIYDSIFGDVQMGRVKFNAKTEYEYLQNYKILQTAFTAHQIERTVPVQQLIKCKMQDNLEFLQFTKRYWDQFFPGGDYDAISRRKGQGGPSTSVGGPPAPRAATGTTTARRPAAAVNSTAVPRTRTPQGGSGVANAVLQNENNALKETVTGLERERDFYFSKLRDIELLIQQAMEEQPELEQEENSLLKQIQTILYSTEEGFEIPQEGEVGEEETF